VLQRPSHPYTQALIDSLPDPETARGTLRAIPGQPPVAGEYPHGCAFWPRCPDARPSCQVDEPVLLRTSDRLVACPVRNPDATAAVGPVWAAANVDLSRAASPPGGSNPEVLP
jgi:oligopeptide/dipeptide ABC transporter ATP-binding protein